MSFHAPGPSLALAQWPYELGEYQQVMQQRPAQNKLKIITKEEWDTLKPLIERLWLAERKPFKYIARILADEYALCPTKRQFDHIVKAWGFSKSIKKKEMEAILRHQAHAGVESFNPTFNYNGREIERSKIRRWIRRNPDFKVMDELAEVDDEMLEVEDESLQENDKMELIGHVPQNNSDLAEKTALFSRFANLDIAGSPNLSRLCEALKSECDYDVPPLSLGEAMITSEEAGVAVCGSQKSESRRNILSALSTTLTRQGNRREKDVGCTRTGVSISFAMATMWNPAETLRRLYEPSPFALPSENSSSGRPRPNPINLQFSISNDESKERELRQEIKQLDKNRIAPLKNWKSLDPHWQLGSVLKRQKRYDEAEHELRLVTEACRDSFGEENRLTLLAYLALSDLLHEKGEFRQALAILRNSYYTASRILAPDDWCRLETMEAIAATNLILGNYGEAELPQRQLVQVQLQIFGPADARTLKSMSVLAQMITEQMNDSAGEHLLRTVIDISRTIVDDVEAWSRDRSRLASIFNYQERWNECISVVTNTLEIAETTLSTSHSSVREMKSNLVCALRESGRPQNGERLAREIVDQLLTIKGPNALETLYAQVELARCLNSLQDYLAAIDLFRAALRGCEKCLGSDNEECTEICYWLGDCYGRLGDYQPAIHYYQRAYDGYARLISDESTARNDVWKDFMSLVAEELAYFRKISCSDLDIRLGDFLDTSEDET